MTSAPNKWKGIYFTDAKPASACPKQMGSQISWLQFQRNAGSLSDRALVWSPDLSQECTKELLCSSPHFACCNQRARNKEQRGWEPSWTAHPLLLLPGIICFRLFHKQGSAADNWLSAKCMPANCLSRSIAVLGNTFLFVVSFYYVQ